ncbi:MAG TPA: DUF177 domain-containing protein [Acidimicrobiales bacterium]|nr:DUF177 domain-containing protein [Acidimicrobiales bacterium]
MGSRQREERHGPIDGLAVSGSQVPAGREVSVDLVLEAVHGGVMATGAVRAPWVAECRRCLGVARGEVEAQVRELFEPDPHQPVEDDTYPLTGDQLDLQPLARDAVLLELPLAPLCTEGCLGLCPTCGANLNQGRCACPAAGGDPRWGALDVLRGQGD